LPCFRKKLEMIVIDKLDQNVVYFFFVRSELKTNVSNLLYGKTLKNNLI
jgi:hypothetical protein